MKRQIFPRRVDGSVLIAAAVLLAACATPSPRGSSSTVPALSSQEPEPLKPGAAPRPDEYLSDYNALHYDIELVLPSNGQVITGNTEIRFSVQRERRDTLVLDFTGLAVTGVRVNGAVVPFRHEVGKLLIPVPPSIAAGSDLRVGVEYRGTPDDGLIIGDNIHGHRTIFADNWPNRARFWFPSIDHPADKATVSFRIDAPEAWQVVANGVLVDRTDDRRVRQTGRRLWRWQMQQPISTYNMVLGAGSMEVRSLRQPCATNVRCIDVTTWLFPEDASKASPSFARAVDMVEFYENRIAPFPYAKLAHVQSATRFLGMENATAIFYPEKDIAEGRNIEDTVAHETAHQWFGDSVTESDWHHLWLSEGFATYFAALFFEKADGVESLRLAMERGRVQIIRSERVRRPIIDPTEQDLLRLLNPMNYSKGAWVLHMLRGLVGDSQFFDAVSRYYRRHEHGTALTSDFQRAVEETTGRELTWFFDQWVFRPGFPRFRLEWQWDAAAKEVEATLRQTQDEAWPVFRTSLTVEIFSGNNASVRQIVQVDEREETLRIPLAEPPSRIAIDPDGWVLKEVESESQR